MSIRSIFDALTSRYSYTLLRRPWSRPARRRAASAQWPVEALEDRCLLSLGSIASYDVGVNPQALATGDFNGDGRADLVTANYNSSTVSVLLGNADGSFAAAGEFATGANPRSVAVGDFNGDGKLDVATANHGGTDLSVLLGNGDGTLGAPVSVGLPTPAPTVVDPPLSVAVGDFNADGKLDLVATSQDSYGWGGWGYYGYYGGTYYRGYVHVILGHGNGSFAAPTTYQLPSGFPMAVAVADVSGDGRLDVVTANQDYGTVSVLLGNGDGTLQYSRDYATGWYPQAVTLGDFTGDGILDIATAGQTVDILPGLGGGTFQPVFRQYFDPTALAAADFNGDGQLDVVAADPWTGTVSVLLGQGNGMLTLPIDHVAGSQPVAVAVGDFNRDGRMDVAVANSGSNNVSILLNDGVWPALNAPSLRINDVTVTEGNTGTVDASFSVTLSAATSRDVTVRYVTGDYSWSSATAGVDYQPVTGQITIPAGQTSATISVPVIGDRIGEYDERFVVNLFDPTGAFIADGQGVATIVDDEPRISIDSSASALEGNSGTTAIDFKVRLSAASDAEVRVNFSTAEGDTQWWGWNWYYYYSPPPAAATAGSDFEAQTGMLVFAPGEIEKTIRILVYGDRLVEPTEAFSVDLSNPVGAAIAAGHGVGYINDDEPRIYFDSYPQVKEGNSGVTYLNFTVKLTAPADEVVTVRYATQDYTAQAGSDYEAQSGTLVFAPGETSKTISIAVYGDLNKESDEYVLVVLSNASQNAEISGGTAWGTIVDDDATTTTGGGKGNAKGRKK